MTRPARSRAPEAMVHEPDVAGQAHGDEQPRLPLDDKVKAFIDYLIDRAIEQWIEANASEAPE